MQCRNLSHSQSLCGLHLLFLRGSFSPLAAVLFFHRATTTIWTSFVRGYVLAEPNGEMGWSWDRAPEWRVYNGPWLTGYCSWRPGRPHGRESPLLWPASGKQGAHRCGDCAFVSFFSYVFAAIFPNVYRVPWQHMIAYGVRPASSKSIIQSRFLSALAAQHTRRWAAGVGRFSSAAPRSIGEDAGRRETGSHLQCAGNWDQGVCVCYWKKTHTHAKENWSKLRSGPVIQFYDGLLEIVDFWCGCGFSQMILIGEWEILHYKRIIKFIRLRQPVGIVKKSHPNTRKEATKLRHYLFISKCRIAVVWFILRGVFEAVGFNCTMCYYFYHVYRLAKSMSKCWISLPAIPFYEIMRNVMEFLIWILSLIWG